MRIAIIGRTEILYETAVQLHAQGHEIGLVLTAKAAPEYKKTEEDFKRLAEALDAPFIQSAKLVDGFELIKSFPPMDIGISFNYTGVIPQTVIDCFRLGILNAHGGDLPRYRGNACQAWAILNGEKRIGLCIHRMIGGELDSGDIIARDYFPLTINTKVTEIWGWLDVRIPQLFEEAVCTLEKKPDFILERQSKDPKDALRCYPRHPEDGRIDWKKDALDILRLINACNKPYAGAFCKYEGEKLIIWDAMLLNDGENYLAVPGQITRIGDGFVEVAAGNGKLRISRIEFKSELIKPDKLIRSIRKRFC
jgi:methionyl-tRNA formyltransferase